MSDSQSFLTAPMHDGKNGKAIVYDFVEDDVAAMFVPPDPPPDTRCQPPKARPLGKQPEAMVEILPVAQRLLLSELLDRVSLDGDEVAEGSMREAILSHG